MIPRPPFVRTCIRGIIVLGAVGIPFVWPAAWAVPVAVLATLLAYEGVERLTLAWLTALAVVCEMAAGLDFGVLALSFLSVAVALSVAGRALSLTPWSALEGWKLTDLVRTAVTAVVASLGMLACSVLIVSRVYGYGMMMTRLQTVIEPSALMTVAITVLVVAVMVRWADTPFRRQIRFGT